MIDAVQKYLFSSKVWSFYQAIMASTGRRLGSPDALKSRSAAIMLQGHNPRHLYSHLSTHIRITKGICMRGVFICIDWSFLYATRGETETCDIGNK